MNNCYNHEKEERNPKFGKKTIKEQSCNEYITKIPCINLWNKKEPTTTIPKNKNGEEDIQGEKNNKKNTKKSEKRERLTRKKKN